MADASTSATKIMGCKVANYHQLGISLKPGISPARGLPEDSDVSQAQIAQVYAPFAREDPL
jgi:hypothetical protein